MKIYYAHCVAIYNTPQEKRDMEILAKVFPSAEIDNPNRPEIQAAYPEKGMAMFEQMAKGCDVLAFRALPDGSIPAGVAKEIEWAQDAGRPIIEIPCAITRRSMPLDITREWLKECGQR